MFDGIVKLENMGCAKLNLADAPRGKMLKVGRFQGGRAFYQKLLSLGFYPGAAVKVISSSKKGPVIAEICGSRVVIGHSMAERISIDC